MKRIYRIIAVSVIAFAFVLTGFVQSFAADKDRFVDLCSLVSYDESFQLNDYLDRISEENGFDFVAVFVPDMGEQGYTSIMEFADDYFDENGFGFGTEYDGVVLAVSMAGRDYWISTSGYGITAITDYGIDYIENAVVPYLSDGDYYQAVKMFASSACELVQQARNGNVYDNYSYGEEDVYVNGDGAVSSRSFNWGSHIFAALVIGIIVGLVVASVMKGNLKSVAMQRSAGNYVVPGSLNLTSSNDVFLYANVAAVPKPKDPPPQSHSGGGSSVHMSSSGHSHGGGGGKF